MTAAELAKKIDHTILKPDAAEKDIRRVCQEAKQYGFATVCVSPLWVHVAANELRNSEPGITTVIGFPHGSTFSAVKAIEVQKALEVGATEVDMVIPIGVLKSGNQDAVLEDILSVVAVARKNSSIIVKVIIETALLSTSEIAVACNLVEQAGADFVKTSTGFGPPLSPDRLLAHVKLLHEHVGSRLGVKAAGGIRTFEQAQALIDAGATRLGCSSSVGIVQAIA